MDAEYQILTVPTANTYTITTATAATSTGTSTATATATYQISVGTAVSQYGYGWGTYEWGKEAWGTARSVSNVTIEGRNWSFDNFGEDLLATVNNGNTFRWDTSVGTGTPAAVISSAPTVSRFNLVSMPDRHVFLFGTEQPLVQVQQKMIYFYDLLHKKITTHGFQQQQTQQGLLEYKTDQKL